MAEIRVRATDDSELLSELDAACFPKDEPFDFDDGRQELWLATVDGQPAGYASAYVWTLPFEPALVLSRAGVLPEFRGRGIQKRLLAARERFARRMGLPEVWTYTLHTNVRSANSLIARGYRLWLPATWHGEPTPWVPNGRQAFLFWRKAL